MATMTSEQIEAKKAETEALMARLKARSEATTTEARMNAMKKPEPA